MLIALLVGSRIEQPTSQPPAYDRTGTPYISIQRIVPAEHEGPDERRQRVGDEHQS